MIQKPQSVKRQENGSVVFYDLYGRPIGTYILRGALSFPAVYPSEVGAKVEGYICLVAMDIKTKISHIIEEMDFLSVEHIIDAENKLAEFLCRIQVASDAQPAVDGGWFRAFDFGRWEHWGCNADLGWGAWAIESGWTQGWITAVLAMRQKKTSLWDLTHDSKIERHHARLRKQMIPDKD